MRGVIICLTRIEYWNNITTMNASTTRAQYWWPQLINYLVLGIYSAITGVYRYIEVTPNDGTIIKEWNTVTIIFFLLTAFNLVGKLYCSSKKIA